MSVARFEVLRAGVLKKISLYDIFHAVYFSLISHGLTPFRSEYFPQLIPPNGKDKVPDGKNKILIGKEKSLMA
jgi:hypothetical protein